MHEPYHTPTTSPANPPHDHTPSASALLPPSTEIDTIQQSPTKHNENSCPPAHAREDYSTTLSFKQIEFLRHLPAEHTITAAAEKAGINRTTFYNWIKDPAFKAEYEHCRSLALTIAKAEISALSLDAADLLHECLKPGYHPAVRVHAAGTILRNAQRLTQPANHSEPAPTPATPTPTHVIPTPSHVIPAKAGISPRKPNRILQSSINNRQSAINNPSPVIPAKAGTPRDEPNEPPESRGPHSLNAVVW